MLLVTAISLMMSSLAGAVNSAAALYTLDFYKKNNPDASERKIVLIGRLFSMAVVTAGIFCFPLIKILDTQIFTLLIYMPVFIAPPIAAVFISGLLSKKVNSNGAVWSFTAAGILAAVKIVSDFELFGLNISVVREMHYLNFAVLLFLITLAVLFFAGIISARKSQTGASAAKLSFINKVNDTLDGRRNLISRRMIRVNTAFSISLAVLVIGIWIFMV
jgi:SSS family solute:Na+ symporter